MVSSRVNFTCNYVPFLIFLLSPLSQRCTVLLQQFSFTHYFVIAGKSISVVPICDMLEMCSEGCCPHALGLPFDKL